MKIQIFTFNDFLEHTYVISGEDGRCVIIDPGCHRPHEVSELSAYIEHAELTPTHIYLTHAHIDHILGLKYCVTMYDIGFSMHPDEDPVFDATPQVAQMYGVPYQATDVKPTYLDDDTKIEMGGMIWRCILAPGHSPGSLCFHQEDSRQLIGGDVLFRESIGRTDLPGGDHPTLLKSIREKILILPEETMVYPGHGPNTSIGHEKKHNPFLNV